MKIHEILPKVKNSVVTIGSFDGLHLGHQELITETQRLAHENNTEEYIISFHPHPRIVLRNNSDFRLLMTLDEKKNKLQELKVKNLVLLPFNETLSQLSAEDFILNYIIKPLNPFQVVLGYDHKFGKDRRGSMDTFFDIKAKYGYTYDITRIEESTNETQNISSTTIRNFIKGHKIAKANNTKENFYKYLHLIYMYSGTLSLYNELPKVNDVSKLKIGDMLIKGGSPGHIVMIADEAINSKDEKIFLLFQGNTPAQSVHLVKNLENSTISPWYQLENNAVISVSNYTFGSAKFVRFK